MLQLVLAYVGFLPFIGISTRSERNEGGEKKKAYCLTRWKLLFTIRQKGRNNTDLLLVVFTHNLVTENWLGVKR